MSILGSLASGAQQFIYTEIFDSISELGKIVSLGEITKGCIGIREEFINGKLERISSDDSIIRSVKVSLKENSGSFFLEMKKFMVRGVAEIPFEVVSFKFNNEEKRITFRIGKKKAIGDNYYSKLLLWFTLSVLGLFNKKKDLLKCVLKNDDCLENNADGSCTINFAKISELKDSFNKPHWKLIRIDGMRLDKETVFLELNRDFAKKLIDLKEDVSDKVKDVRAKVKEAKDIVNIVSGSAKEKIQDMKERIKNRKW